MEDANEWFMDAEENIDVAQADYDDSIVAWNDAQADYANYDYDPTQEYNTYDDWEAPDNFDDFFTAEVPEADLCSVDFIDRAGDNFLEKC